MQNHDQESQIEVLPPNALEAITRGEIDVQISTAHRFPRSMQQFRMRAIEMATLDEETAASCIYSRPVGGGKFAEGLSVRMAEIVGACYGNLRVGAMIVSQTERVTTCRGYAHDLQSNFASTSETVESTVKRDGSPYDERMRAVIAKAALAKARRDATFQVVPKALCRSIEIEARKVAIGDATTIEKRRQNVVTWIERLGIPKERVWASLNIQGEGDLGIEELTTLVGLKTAIKDGEVSVDEAFPAIGSNPDGAPKFVPKPKVEPKPEPKPEPKAQEPAAAKPQEAASKPAVVESTETAPAAEKPAQTTASPTDWRQAIIPGKHPKLSGHALGEHQHEMQEVKAYADGIDLKRATADQKRFIAQVAMAMAELFPKSGGEELSLEGEPAFDHVKALNDLITQNKWEPAFFVQVCKMSGWVAEARRQVSDITPEEFEIVSDKWDQVEAEMEKAHQTEQQP